MEFKLNTDMVVYVYICLIYLLLTHLFKWRGTWIMISRALSICIQINKEKRKKYLTCHRSYLVLALFHIILRVYLFNKRSNRRLLSKIKFIGYLLISSISLINIQTMGTVWTSLQSMMIYVFFHVRLTYR